MKTIREQFEEIWPVPYGVYWSPVFEAYVCADGSYLRLKCTELNLRLDTFTRCQESMGPVLLLVDELIEDLKWMNDKHEDYYLLSQIAYAKQVLRDARK